jgi:hypothetical protein
MVRKLSGKLVVFPSKHPQNIGTNSATRGGSHSGDPGTPPSVPPSAGVSPQLYVCVCDP